MKRVDFEFTKDWGSIKKGTVRELNIALARSLQDIRKVGKIKKAGVTPEKEKMVKPEANKMDKKAVTRQTK